MRLTSPTIAEELSALEEGRIDPSSFPHLEHVRLAFEMLRRGPFAEAAMRFGNGLRLMTAKAGKPEIYSETTTGAFLALIGERIGLTSPNEWSEFIALNADLADKHLLERWYEPEEMKTELARKTFLLPRAKRDILATD